MITYDEIYNAVVNIVNNPTLGGLKGALKLLNDKKACIGETVYKEIKKKICLLAEEEYKEQEELSKLEKNQYSRNHEKMKDFEHKTAKDVDDIWAIDFVYIWLFGIRFVLCVVYDIYSQSYLAIKPNIIADVGLARNSILEAIKFRGTIPQECIIFDGGKQFSSDSFSEILSKCSIISNMIPPGSPWFNGALESGNKDLKKILYTQLFYNSCDENNSISHKSVSEEEKLDFLITCCSETLTKINNEIAYCKNLVLTNILTTTLSLNSLKN